MDVTTPPASAPGNGPVVITHAEMGIYLGSCMGLGFWSKLDPVGQPSAVTFPSIEAAREHMAFWERETPLEVVFRSVTPDDGFYASIAACVAAGLDGWVDETTPVANDRPL